MEEERKSEIPPSRPAGPGQAGGKATREETVEMGTPLNPSAGPGQALEGQLNALKAEVEESNREKSQFREMLQRSQADFINYRRRNEEEREEQQKYANSRLILKLLPALDDLNQAIDYASREGAEPSWLEGIKLVHRKFHSLLESENVVKIQAEGKEFDPFEHEAMAFRESTDHQEGRVLTVVRAGYKLHGRVIRPAQVMLAKKPETAEDKRSLSTGKETGNA